MLQKNALKVSTPGDREILMTREFDAPRAMVWDALTKPELLKLWMFCPPGWSMAECVEDLRVGGTFRWSWNGPDGKIAMSMHGVYREVKPREKIVRTETFVMGCDHQLGEQLVTLMLKDRGERTFLEINILYPNKESRDGMIASGMEHGVSAGYNKLEEILAESHRVG